MNVKEIELAITQLPPAELEEFTTWFEEFLAEAWDKQIEEDEQAGRLDALLQRAEREFNLRGQAPLRHLTTSDFWARYEQLPVHIRELADKNFELLKADPEHPSLHFRRIGRLWSVRVGLRYRALGWDKEDAIVWFWIGSHAEYDELLHRN